MIDYTDMKQLQAGDKLVLTFTKSPKGPTWTASQTDASAPAGGAPAPSAAPMPGPPPAALPTGSAAPDDRQMLLQAMASHIGRG